MAVILESKAVCKYFGGLKAVNNVDMKVEQGQIFGIIGPNGAGKTTFFNLCSGTYKVTSGQILFDGRDITNLSPPRKWPSWASCVPSRTSSCSSTFRCWKT